MSRMLEEVTGSHSQAHIIMSADVSSIANTGFIIVKRSGWSVAFIQKWLDVRLSDPLRQITEQQGFESIFNQFMNDPAVDDAEKRKLVIIDTNVLNSVAPPMFWQLPTDPILHLAAESDALRGAVFERGAKCICNTAEALSKPSMEPSVWQRNLALVQLDLNQPFLLETAVAV
jgi:hypothetical protein